MNTNNIKSFAREARLLLLDSVLQRLKYWGFQEDGSTTVNVESLQGGYTFRGKVFTDVTVPAKWQKLKDKLTSAQAVQDVVEEVAYTWFNRLLAIKILEVNGYIAEQLAYTAGSRTPLIVQNAKRGDHTITNKADQQLLLEFLKEDKDEEAFALLITHLCHSNRLLHDIYGSIDDYTEILFPQHSLKIDGLLDLINSDAIEVADFKEVELIGWLYQFYISDKKDAVFKGFKKNIKARAQDIPAATQIFTPKWIVSYMVENTVGKIYLDYEPDSTLRDQMKYLVSNERDNTVTDNVSPRAESRDHIPHPTSLITELKELTLIDPAAGSGHILVTGFELFFKMYREAGYTAKQAVENILTHNLYGLDIDDRAMQLARFAVLLKAAQYDAAILEQPIQPHIYSFPADALASWFTTTYYSKSQSNWQDLLGMQLAAPVSLQWEETKKNKTKTHKVTFKKGDVLNEKVVDLLQQHYEEAIAVDHAPELEFFWGDAAKPWDYCEFFYAIQLLRQGKNLGSALQLNISPEVYTYIKNTYNSWLLKEQNAQLNIEETSVFNQLKPFIEVLLVLANQYKAVVANPPYMGPRNMNLKLKKYTQSHYPKTKADLFAIFIEVSLNLLYKDGLVSIINQESWLFNSSYKLIRNQIINENEVKSLLHLGTRTFDEMSGEKVRSVAFTLGKIKNNTSGVYYRLTDANSSNKKNEAFLKAENIYRNVNQTKFKEIEGEPFAYWISSKVLGLFKAHKNLSQYSSPRKGNSTSDNDRFLKYWFEVNISKCAFNSNSITEALNLGKNWIPYNKGGGTKKWYGYNEYIIDWTDNGDAIRKIPTSVVTNEKFYMLPGLTWSAISSKAFGLRYFNEGFIFDNNGCCLFDLNENKDYLAGLLNSKVFYYIIGQLSPALAFHPGDVKKFPVIFEDKKIVSKDNYHIAKLDWDSRETSWDYKKSPLLNESTSLNEAYHLWRDKAAQDFFQLHSNEEELNRIFIDIYGLQEELTPAVALKDITILQEELSGKDLEALEPTFREKGAAAVQLPINKTEVLSQFISYAIGVFLGRYRLDQPGLNIAHPNPSAQELAAYKYNEHIITIDEDGIVPLMGENAAFPDDALVRTKELLLAIWGEQTLTENINFIQDALGMDLHKWLTEKFWKYHTSMYNKKPIYWLFSSNVKKPQNAAFKVLVYMHRMDKYTVQQIQRNYLYPHQEHIKNELAKLEQDEDSLNKEQQKQLEQWRHWQLECRDYNEVLKTLANQQIEIDLDDGVTVNYTKFEGAVAVI